MKLFDEIYKYLESCAPREGCGVIGIVDGKEEWFPCENHSEEEDGFIMSSTDFIKAAMQSKIIAVIHSHVNSTVEPSEHDKAASDLLKIPYYIIGVPSKKVYKYEP